MFRYSADGVEYSGELVRMNTSDSLAAASKASFVDLTKDESSVEEAVLSVCIETTSHD